MNEREIHVHAWLPDHPDDEDPFVDMDVIPTGYYGDHIQYTFNPTTTIKNTDTIEIRIPYPTKGNDHALYEWGTYAATDRLAALREGRATLTEQDVLDLFAAFVDGSASCGVNPQLVDFGAFLTGWYEGDHMHDPAEVTW